MEENTLNTGELLQAADPAQIPGSLLPNIGEGGPVYSGETDAAQTPALPLPNPGEGGAVFPGVQPLPQPPTFVLSNSAVRFVNAARGYPALRVSVDGTRVVALLSSGEVSCYNRIAPGTRTVTVTGTDGYIYLQRPLTFANGSAYLIVIAPRNGGLDLTQAEDTCIV